MRNMKLINDFKMEKVAKKVLEVMAEKAAKGLKGAYVELTKEQVLDIYKAAL